MAEQEIYSFFQKHREKYLESIQKLIRIPSVSHPDEDEKYPFGESCARALDVALTMGKEMGFLVQNHAYYCGSIILPGVEEKEIGIFAHLDVVPEGDGWKRPPYEPYIEDGWLFGRGSADNKGPAITALYAIYCLKELGVKLKHTVRLVLGCSEENGMRDIQYYVKYYPLPVFSFTPDASFSVCYAEKGIIEAEFYTTLPNEILEFSAGVASNAVAGKGYAILPAKAEEKIRSATKSFPNIEIEIEQEYLKVQATGISAHAAFPEGAVNAGAKLAEFLCKSEWLGKDALQVLAFPAKCFKEHYGNAFGIAYEESECGRLTAICGMIRTEGNHLILNANIRYPAGMQAEKIKERLNEKAHSYGWKTSFINDDPPMYMSPECPVIKVLNDICIRRLGKNFTPYSMGGGTYARRLPNAVAFGPGIQGQKKPGLKGHGEGHQPDECVQLKTLEDAFYIYVQALQEIDQLV